MLAFWWLAYHQLHQLWGLNIGQEGIQGLLAYKYKIVIYWLLWEISIAIMKISGGTAVELPFQSNGGVLDLIKGHINHH